MAAYEAVLFDLDATLLDTEALLDRAIQRVLSERFGVTFTVEQLEHLRGAPDLGPGSWTEVAIREFSLGIGAEELNTAVYEVFDAHVEECEAMPGAYDVVARLHAAGVKLAIATSSRADSVARKRVRHTALFAPFRTVVTVEDVHPRAKPHPDCYVMAAARLGVDVRRCVVVEDSPTGVRAGLAAGAAAVIAVPMPSHADTVRALGATAVLASLCEWKLEHFFPEVPLAPPVALAAQHAAIEGAAAGMAAAAGVAAAVAEAVEAAPVAAAAAAIAGVTAAATAAVAHRALSDVSAKMALAAGVAPTAGGSGASISAQED